MCVCMCCSAGHVQSLAVQVTLRRLEYCWLERKLRALHAHTNGRRAESGKPELMHTASFQVVCGWVDGWGGCGGGGRY